MHDSPNTGTTQDPRGRVALNSCQNRQAPADGRVGVGVALRQELLEALRLLRRQQLPRGLNRQRRAAAGLRAPAAPARRPRSFGLPRMPCRTTGTGSSDVPAFEQVCIGSVPRW